MSVTCFWTENPRLQKYDSNISLLYNAKLLQLDISKHLNTQNNYQNHNQKMEKIMKNGESETQHISKSFKHFQTVYAPCQLNLYLRIKQKHQYFSKLQTFKVQPCFRATEQSGVVRSAFHATVVGNQLLLQVNEKRGAGAKFLPFKNKGMISY